MSGLRCDDGFGYEILFLMFVLVLMYSEGYGI